MNQPTYEEYQAAVAKYKEDNAHFIAEFGIIIKIFKQKSTALYEKYSKLSIFRLIDEEMIFNMNQDMVALEG